LAVPTGRVAQRLATERYHNFRAISPRFPEAAKAVVFHHIDTTIKGLRADREASRST